MPEQNVRYDFDGQNWTKVIFPEDCPHKFCFGQQCQGTLGHNGFHWCYTSKGHLIRNSDRAGIAEENIPPDNEDWVHPLRFLEGRAEAVKESVTDPILIERLGRGDILDSESITRPLDEEELQRLAERGHVPDWSKFSKKDAEEWYDFISQEESPSGD